MTTNQVWDDDYREPRLEEGVLVNQEDMFGRCQHIHPTNLRMNLRLGAVSVTLRPLRSAESRSAVSCLRSQKYSGPAYPYVRKGLADARPLMFAMSLRYLRYVKFVTQIS